MTKSNKQVDLNKKNIRKNKRHIFELECQASTALCRVYAIDCGY
jgi:hypothetical protein